MGSLYNMIFGKNPDTKDILALIGLTEGDVERFRDCFIEDGEIVILTRTGGLNREDFKNKELISNPHYLYDRDDDFDNTYAYYHFSIPAEHKEG